MTPQKKLAVSLTIALGVVTVCFLITRQARTTSLEKPPTALGQPALATAKAAEPAKGDSEKNTLKEFPINDAFEFPFLGKVKAHARTEPLTYVSASGVRMTFPLKVYYTPNGVFARAEYFRPGAEDYELPLLEAEKNYRSSGETIHSIPEQAATANLQSILDNLHRQYGGQFEQSTKFNITYVLWEQSGQPPKPVIIINMFGTGKSVPKSPDKPVFLRIRLVFDVDGNIIFFDNVI